LIRLAAKISTVVAANSAGRDIPSCVYGVVYGYFLRNSFLDHECPRGSRGDMRLEERLQSCLSFQGRLAGSTISGSETRIHSREDSSRRVRGSWTSVIWNCRSKEGVSFTLGRFILETWLTEDKNGDMGTKIELGDTILALWSETYQLRWRP
jgi:hypothetical protein